MNQMLLRGYCLSPDNRIKRMLSSGAEWQIYSTSNERNVLAVTEELLSVWSDNYELPEGLFTYLPDCGCSIFQCKGSCIIASLKEGPFPDSYLQVEAFAAAFKSFLVKYPGVSLEDALYLEEYSILLPTAFDQGGSDNGMVFGRWITGGVGVSINSLDRVSKIMSWLPKEQLIKAAELAGFDIAASLTEETPAVADVNIEGKSIENVPAEQLMSRGERFSLPGRPELEHFFNDNIIDVVMHREQYERMGIHFPGATILYGPPGCGKTYAVEKLSEYLGWKRFDIDSSTIASSYIHDTSKKISEVFEAAIKAAPSVLVIDEMEAFLSDRGMSGHSGTHHIEEVAEFLRQIPEAINRGVLIFAMTNMIESIDPAILRRGRFDHIIEVKMASAEEIEELLKNQFAKLPVDEGVDPRAVAEHLSGHPLSDVSFVLREAGRFAVKRNLDTITAECINDALALIPKKKEKNPIGFANSKGDTK